MMKRPLLAAALLAALTHPVSADQTISEQMENSVIRTGYNLGFMGRFAMACTFRKEFEDYARGYLRQVDERFGAPEGDASLSQKYRNAYNNGFALAEKNLENPEAHVNCGAVEQSFRNLRR